VREYFNLPIIGEGSRFREGVVAELQLDLLRTCRQIHNEAHALPAQLTTVLVNSDDVHNLDKFLRLAPTGLTSLSFRTWVGFDPDSLQNDWEQELVFEAAKGKVDLAWGLKRTERLSSLKRVHLFIRPLLMVDDPNQWSGYDQWNKVMKDREARVLEAIREGVLPGKLRGVMEEAGVEVEMDLAWDEYELV
jgi:hypothetical protein